MKALLLIGIVLLAPQRDSDAVTGRWLWQGKAGWQRIVLDLKLEGPKLSGVMRMGPGGIQAKSPADYWEYFFDPTEFKIINGKIDGNTLYFEHEFGRSSPTQTVLFVGVTNPSFNSKLDGKFIYRGTIRGDKLSVTRELVAKPQDPWSLGTHKVSFVMDRVD